MKYRVGLTGVANVAGTLVVEANSVEEAAALALSRLGDVEWKYEGLVEDSPHEEMQVSAGTPEPC